MSVSAEPSSGELDDDGKGDRSGEGWHRISLGLSLFPLAISHLLFLSRISYLAFRSPCDARDDVDFARVGQGDEIGVGVDDAIDGDRHEIERILDAREPLDDSLQQLVNAGRVHGHGVDPARVLGEAAPEVDGGQTTDLAMRAGDPR